MNQEKIGQFIAKLRNENNMTQQELADKIGVTDRAVSKWENGRGLPDPSIMLELCSALKITLNELFAGEKIKEKYIITQSENNIINLLKFNNLKIKKNKIIFSAFSIIVILLLVISSRMLLIQKGYIVDDRFKYTQTYLPGEENIKGNVDVVSFQKKNVDYDIGANKYGYAVFKYPDKALNRMKKDCSKGLKIIQKEFNLLPLNAFNFRSYKTYGWQVTIGSKEEQEQAMFVSSFLDIYENSFN